MRIARGGFRMRGRLGVAAFMAVIAVANSGIAEDSVTMTYSQPPDISPRRGFYARITMGAGWPYVVVEGHDLAGASLSAAGFAVYNDLLLGHDVAPGFVLGGAVCGGGAASLSLDADGRPANDTDIDFYLFGPFADVYPWEKNGLHFGGTLGFAWVRPSMAPNPGTTETLGVGGSAWAGYDWGGVGEASAGVMGRFSSTFTAGQDYGAEIAVSSFALSILATATYF